MNLGRRLPICKPRAWDNWTWKKNKVMSEGSMLRCLDDLKESGKEDGVQLEAVVSK